MTKIAYENQTGVNLFKKYIRKAGKVVRPHIKNYNTFLNASKIKQGLILENFISNFLRKENGERFYNKTAKLYVEHIQRSIRDHLKAKFQAKVKKSKGM